ncbi:MAG: type IV secretion system DNA-binding domain-containing protein [Gammaproteobacteria bacterium]|nr:type IV secretion system DNA-binding domain-containing protein [Gammaproteobacteria bacterium]
MPDKSKHSSTLQVIRGGQIILHNLRMLSQVFQQLFLIIVLVFSVIFGVWYFEVVDDYSRYITGEWVIAKMRVALNIKSNRKFELPNGQVIQTNAYEVISASKVVDIKDDVFNRAERVLWIDLVISLVILSFISYLLRAYGKQKTQSTHIKGDRRELANVLRKWLVRDKKNSPYTLGREKLPLVKYTEMQHILFSGSTGSGKSTAIRQLLDHIRARGEKVFIYDKGCSFVQDYFRIDEDVLLNPLDQRSAHWDFWGECPTKAHFDNRAAALIPMPHNSSDPFWVNAARTIFSAAAYQMARTSKNPSLLRLLRNLLTADIGELKALLAGTEAETLMSEKIEKTAVSIKSVLATYLKSLCFLTEGNEPFSIRRWVEDDQQKKLGVCDFGWR